MATVTCYGPSCLVFTGLMLIAYSFLGGIQLYILIACIQGDGVSEGRCEMGGVSVGRCECGGSVSVGEV